MCQLFLTCSRETSCLASNASKEHSPLKKIVMSSEREVLVGNLGRNAQCYLCFPAIHPRLYFRRRRKWLLSWDVSPSVSPIAWMHFERLAQCRRRALEWWRNIEIWLLCIYVYCHGRETQRQMSCQDRMSWFKCATWCMMGRNLFLAIVFSLLPLLFVLACLIVILLSYSSWLSYFYDIWFLKTWVCFGSNYRWLACFPLSLSSSSTLLIFFDAKEFNGVKRHVSRGRFFFYFFFFPPIDDWELMSARISSSITSTRYRSFTIPASSARDNATAELIANNRPSKVQRWILGMITGSAPFLFILICWMFVSLCVNNLVRFCQRNRKKRYRHETSPAGVQSVASMVDLWCLVRIKISFVKFTCENASNTSLVYLDETDW